MELLSVDRFVGHVNQNLICPICMCVLNEPVQDENEHTFCKQCIFKWMERQVTCPIDRAYISRYKLKPASRLLKNLLAELELSCDYKEHGCNKIVKLEQLQTHLNECLYQPNRIIECPNGCEVVIERNEINTHNCIKELKKENKDLKRTLEDLDMKYKKLEDDLNELKQNSSSVNQIPTNTTNTNSSTSSNNESFLSYNFLFKLLILIILAFILKYSFSTELLIILTTLCILFASYNILFYGSNKLCLSFINSLLLKETN